MIVKEAFWAGYLSQKTELEKTAMSPGMSALVGGGVGAGLGAGAGYLTADDDATSNQKLMRSLIGGGIGGVGGAGLGYGLGSMFAPKAEPTPTPNPGAALSEETAHSAATSLLGRDESGRNVGAGAEPSLKDILARPVAEPPMAIGAEGVVKDFPPAPAVPALGTPSIGVGALASGMPTMAATAPFPMDAYSIAERLFSKIPIAANPDNSTTYPEGMPTIWHAPWTRKLHSTPEYFYPNLYIEKK